MKSYYLSLLVLFFILFSSFKIEQELYVDANYQCREMNGTSEKPFSTVDLLVKHIKRIKKEESQRAIKVYFKKGTYHFNSGYLIESNFNNVTFSAFNDEKVIFSGGIDLPIDKVKPYRDNVSTVSLADLGIKDYGTIHSVGFARPSQNSWMELFVNGKPMHLSRWPNQGMIPMGKVIDKGGVPRDNDFSNKSAVMKYDSARISSWEKNNDIWMSGYFHYGYADDALRIASIDKKNKTITTDGATLYGFDSSNAWNKWYAFNIKEETDEKGEFFIDKKKEELYFVSPDSLIKNLVLSQLDTPFFTMNGVSNFK